MLLKLATDLLLFLPGSGLLTPAGVQKSHSREEGAAGQ